MGRAYAGILGTLAFALVTARSLASGGGVEATLLAASAALFAFAALGYVAGQTADYLVRESVSAQFRTAMAAWDQRQKDEQQKNEKTQPQATT